MISAKINIALLKKKKITTFKTKKLLFNEADDESSKH